ncbi:MAG: hypothetical protein M1818_001773 [Claussenomyces sp. TS43310]|nr:MAG: hypothetical protein M1818_001773 [Claussenomyces sp. TS43310]
MGLPTKAKRKAGVRCRQRAKTGHQDRNQAKQQARSCKIKNLRPRFCPEDKLLKRFYEPLVLLHVLDRQDEQRISRSGVDDSCLPDIQVRELRRILLDQLAYICDYLKGGATVTAMALETRPSGLIIWLASNDKPKPKVVTFLREVLDLLTSLSDSDSEHARARVEADLAQKIIAFNLKKIKAYRDLMRPHLHRCLLLLGKSDHERDRIAEAWLSEFNDVNRTLEGLSHHAYKERAGQGMAELRRQIAIGTAEPSDTNSKRTAFATVRHYIGRLGSHLKATKTLVAAAHRLPELLPGVLEGYSIECRPSPGKSKTAPPTDNLTTLNGIVNRMISGDKTKLQQYQEALAFMDAKFHILDRLLAVYKHKDFKPRVHAELILLDFFHQNRLEFVDDDKFIGCSKPACYCCYHYISSHPGGFVRPASHGIRYLSWRPPGMVVSASDSQKKFQRNVLNSMIAQIRLDTLRQIAQRRGPSGWRFDSTTGITSSMDGDGLGLTVLQSSERADSSISTEQAGSDRLPVDTSYSEREEAYADGISEGVHDDEDSSVTSDSDGGVPLLD